MLFARALRGAYLFACSLTHSGAHGKAVFDNEMNTSFWYDFIPLCNGNYLEFDVLEIGELRAVSDVVGGVAMDASGRFSVVGQSSEEDDEDDLEEEVKLGEAFVLPSILDHRLLFFFVAGATHRRSLGVFYSRRF